MLSQPVFEFTPIRAPHEAVVKSCIECSRLFSFSCSTFSKSSVCYEQAVGQRHQSQCQSIRVHHTVIPTRMPSIQNNTRISLFVTELYLRNWVFGHHVSASSRPTGLQLSHGEFMIQLPSLLLNASVLPCRAQGIWRFQFICVGTELVLWLRSIVHRSKSLYYTVSAVGIIFSLFWSTPRTTRQPLRLRTCCRKLVTLSDHMEHSSRGDLQLL